MPCTRAQNSRLLRSTGNPWPGAAEFTAFGEGAYSARDEHDARDSLTLPCQGPAHRARGRVKRGPARGHTGPPPRSDSQPSAAPAAQRLSTVIARVGAEDVCGCLRPPAMEASGDCDRKVVDDVAEHGSPEAGRSWNARITTALCQLLEVGHNDRKRKPLIGLGEVIGDGEVDEVALDRHQP